MAAGELAAMSSDLRFFGFYAYFRPSRRGTGGMRV
jgi:hypothetical protein